MWGVMSPRETVLRVYKRCELEGFLVGLVSPFTGEQVERELRRRDDLERCKGDTLRWPDLSHS